MPAPIGRDVGLYYDSPRAVAAGDYLQTPTGRTYLVRAVRVQAKGIHVGRKHIRAIVVDGATVADSATVHPIYWYKR